MRDLGHAGWAQRPFDCAGGRLSRFDGRRGPDRFLVLRDSEPRSVRRALSSEWHRFSAHLFAAAVLFVRQFRFGGTRPDFVRIKPSNRTQFSLDGLVVVLVNILWSCGEVEPDQFLRVCGRERSPWRSGRPREFAAIIHVFLVIHQCFRGGSVGLFGSRGTVALIPETRTLSRRRLPAALAGSHFASSSARSEWSESLKQTGSAC